MDPELEKWLDSLEANSTVEVHLRRGIVYDEGWPFRLDISVEYQDWIIVAISALVAFIWCMPCIAGKTHNACSRSFTSWVYTRLHVFYWGVLYLTLLLMMFTVGIMPDWTFGQFLDYLGKFMGWMLEHSSKLITSITILFGFWIILKFRERIVYLAGMEHITVFRFSVLHFLGLGGKKRPVELFIWKVEGLQSASGKMLKANDVFIECHMGFNEPMRTRVHNNAGSGCVIQESLQFNIDESSPSTLLTLLVKDQQAMFTGELARMMLSTRELLGIEEQTGKRRSTFDYSEEFFVPLSLSPMGRVWLAIAPVEDWDDAEQAPLMQDDSLLLCC